MDEWVRCENRLPPTGELVLLYNMDDDHMFIADILAGDIWDDGGQWGRLVGVHDLYWMLAPGKPEAGDETDPTH